MHRHMSQHFSFDTDNGLNEKIAPEPAIASNDHSRVWFGTIRSVLVAHQGRDRAMFVPLIRTLQSLEGGLRSVPFHVDREMTPCARIGSTICRIPGDPP
jgi:hypothetical protein